MEHNKEDFYEMEIRVVVQLPGDTYEDFDKMKKNRKFTGYMQDMIDTHTDPDVTIVRGGESNSSTNERMERLEDGFGSVLSLLKDVMKENEVARNERSQQMELMKSQMDIQNELMRSIATELGNVSKRPVEVVQPVADNSMPLEMMSKMVEMMQGMAVNNAGTVANEAVAEAVPTAEPEIEKGALITKKPKKNKKLSAMMDI